MWQLAYLDAQKEAGTPDNPDEQICLTAVAIATAL